VASPWFAALVAAAAAAASLAVVGCVQSSYPAYGSSSGAPADDHLSELEIDSIPNAFPTTLLQPRDHRLQPIADSLFQRNGVAGMGKLTSIYIRLTQVHVPVTIAQCGEANASYTASTQSIEICYELVALANKLAGKPIGTVDSHVQFVLAFTALHEMAHALIDLMHLQVENEEDRADQFALLMMTNLKDGDLAREVVYAPAGFFAALDEAERSHHASDDPHSASIDRAAAAICILYGRQHDPALGAKLGQGAASCEAMTQDALRTWNGWLQPYTRLDTGRTF
jgi:hypothetical protein